MFVYIVLFTVSYWERLDLQDCQKDFEYGEAVFKDTTCSKLKKHKRL